MLTSNQSEAELYQKALKFKLKENRLRSNGFPRPSPTPDKAMIYTRSRGKPQVGDIRTCSKCHKEYKVDSDGFPIVVEKCMYHNKGMLADGLYPCCNKRQNSIGCIQAAVHIYEYVDHKNLQGFVRTKPSNNVAKNKKIFAFDCEMSYTNKGKEPTKISVVDSNRKIVYETFIKPINPIVEYNEQFSGVNEEMMNNCTTTLKDVHAKLLEMWSDKTILVGHSLNHDLKALNLVHDFIIDTSILYPHDNPKQKMSLKALALKYLKRNIQDSNKGHSSHEDALACMDLLLLKLKKVR